MTKRADRARGVAWVKFKRRAQRKQGNGLLGMYRWWPVYVAKHEDPQLGPVGSIEHFHIAWPCVPEKRITRMFWFIDRSSRDYSHGMVIHSRDVQRLDFSKRTRPRFPGGAPLQVDAAPMERALMGREGPFEPAAHNRCPHRGAPLEHGTHDASGCLRCPWHGIRIKARTAASPKS